jgi:hypothetical protein
MFILMISYNFCLLPTQFYYIIIYVWKVESHVQIVDQCASWKIFSGADNLILLKKTKLHGPSPRANYTDRATAACRRSDCQLLRIEGEYCMR